MVEINFHGKSPFEMPGTYRIRVGGAINPKWSNWLGGMAIITAWWGIWHIIAGLVAAFIFSRRPIPKDTHMQAEGVSPG